MFKRLALLLEFLMIVAILTLVSMIYTELKAVKAIPAFETIDKINLWFTWGMSKTVVKAVNGVRWVDYKRKRALARFREYANATLAYVPGPPPLWFTTGYGDFNAPDPESEDEAPAPPPPKTAPKTSASTSK
jgi:hypothetical protein